MKSKRHRPSTWEKLTGIRVIDPDGWRADGKSWNAPLTRLEWNRRYLRSTINLKITNQERTP